MNIRIIFIFCLCEIHLAMCDEICDANSDSIIFLYEDHYYTCINGDAEKIACALPELCQGKDRLALNDNCSTDFIDYECSATYVFTAVKKTNLCSATTVNKEFNIENLLYVCIAKEDTSASTPKIKYDLEAQKCKINSHKTSKCDKEMKPKEYCEDGANMYFCTYDSSGKLAVTINKSNSNGNQTVESNSGEKSNSSSSENVESGNQSCKNALSDSGCILLCDKKNKKDCNQLNQECNTSKYPDSCPIFKKQCPHGKDTTLTEQDIANGWPRRDILCAHTCGDGGCPARIEMEQEKNKYENKPNDDGGKSNSSSSDNVESGNQSCTNALSNYQCIILCDKENKKNCNQLSQDCDDKKCADSCPIFKKQCPYGKDTSLREQDIANGWPRRDILCARTCGDGGCPAKSEMEQEKKKYENKPNDDYNEYY